MKRAASLLLVPMFVLVLGVEGWRHAMESPETPFWPWLWRDFSHSLVSIFTWPAYLRWYEWCMLLGILPLALAAAIGISSKTLGSDMEQKGNDERNYDDAI